MKQLKSHDFADVYKWLGINLNKLGCIMLDLQPLIQGYDIRFLGLPLHKSPNDERFWIDGWVADKVPHITLLYGLLEEGKNYTPHIEKVLSGWKMEEVEIEDIGFFPSPYRDEEYWCIVAHIKKTPELIEGHQRLEFLPHINTFAGYQPHMTICYMDKVSEKNRDEWIQEFRNIFIGKKIKVSPGINYGGNK